MTETFFSEDEEPSCKPYVRFDYYFTHQTNLYYNIVL